MNEKIKEEIKRLEKRIEELKSIKPCYKPKHNFQLKDKVKIFNGEIGVISEVLDDYNYNGFDGYETYRVDICDRRGISVRKDIIYTAHELEKVANPKVK